MTIKISGPEIDEFCKKLEKFSAGLSDGERTLFKSILGTELLSEQALSQVRGGFNPSSISALSFSHAAPTLNASFFRVMCW
jgi:hypothetical protein